MKEHSLLEIATIKSGKRLPKGHELSNIPSPYPYIKARDIKKGKVNSVGLEFVDESTRKKIAKYIVSENDILITIVANIGDVGIVPKKLNNANLTENAVRLTNLKLFVNAQYLTYLLSQKEYKEYMESLAAGAAQAKLGIYKIEKIKVNLPEIAIQKRIASILSAYDDLIEVNNKRIELLEQSARELYKEWFVRMRFPNYQNTKFNKGIPEGWKEELLGNILEFAYGKALKEENRIWGKYPIYGSSGVVGFHIKPLIKSPAIIIGRKGNVGSVFFSFQECYPIDTVFYIVSPYSKLYLYQLLKGQTFIEGDAAIPGLSRNQVYKTKILFPNKKIIDLYDMNIRPIFTQIENLQKQNQELAAIRDRLLPRLISGKLEVKV